VIRIVYTDSDCPSRYILSRTTATHGRGSHRHLSSFLMETVGHEQAEITCPHAFTTPIDPQAKQNATRKPQPPPSEPSSSQSGLDRRERWLLLSSSTLNEELLFRMLLAVRMPYTSYTSPPETFPMPCTHHLVRLDAHVAISNPSL
jgi:hypothetical protein